MTRPEPNELLLEPSPNRLFRQVPSAHLIGGVLSSLAFRPLPKDNGELSVDVEPLTSPKQCYEAFMANGWNTIGVWAVTILECAEKELRAFHKPITEPPVNPSHGYVDFKPFKEKEQRKKGALLAEYAMKRGKLYPLPGA